MGPSQSPRLALNKVPQRIGIDLDDPRDLPQTSPLFIEALNLPKALVQLLSSLVLGWRQTKLER